MADDSKLTEFLAITESGDIEGASRLLVAHNNNLDAAINAFFTQREATHTQIAVTQGADRRNAEARSLSPAHLPIEPPVVARRQNGIGPSIQTNPLQQTWVGSDTSNASRGGFGALIRSAISMGTSTFWWILGYTQQNQEPNGMQNHQGDQNQENKVNFFDLGSKENTEFVAALLDEYKYLLFPRIFTGSYPRALETAARLNRALLVVLHAPDHSDTPVFMRRVLCDSKFRKFLDQRCVVWITPITKPDGCFLANALRASNHFPAFALLVPERSYLTSSLSAHATPPSSAVVRFERGGVPPPLSRSAVSPHRAVDYYYKRVPSQHGAEEGASEAKSQSNSERSGVAPCIPKINDFVGLTGPLSNDRITDSQSDELDEEAISSFPWVELGHTASSLAQVPAEQKSADSSSQSNGSQVISANSSSCHQQWLTERRTGRVFVDGLVSALRTLLDAYEEEERQNEAAALSRAESVAATAQAARALHRTAAQNALQSSMSSQSNSTPSAFTDSVMSVQDAEFAQAMQEDLERIRARRAAERAERELAEREQERENEEQIETAKRECSLRRREHALQKRSSGLEKRRIELQEKLKEQLTQCGSPASSTSPNSRYNNSNSISHTKSSEGDKFIVGVKFPSGKRISLTVSSQSTSLNDLLELIECSEAAVSELFQPPPLCNVHNLSHPDSHHNAEKYLANATSAESKQSAAWHHASANLQNTSPYIITTAMPRNRFRPSQFNALLSDLVSNRTMLLVEVFPLSYSGAESGQSTNETSSKDKNELASDSCSDEALARALIVERSKATNVSRAVSESALSPLGSRVVEDSP